MRTPLIVGGIAVALAGSIATVALARGDKPAEAPQASPASASPTATPPDASQSVKSTVMPSTSTPTATALFPNGLPVDIGPLPSGLASASAQGCAACHWTAHDTWATGAHARAGQAPAYRAALHAAGDTTACTQCHQPLAVQHAQLAAGYVEGDISRPRMQPNPSFDATLLSEGVTCAACHLRAGTVLGTRDMSDAPHPVRASAELADGVTACATCHQLSWPEGDRPFYDTVGEWKASQWAGAGVTCVTCHMPPEGTARLGGAGGVPTHGAGADLARALTVLVHVKEPVARRGQPFAVELVLQNTGAGHSFPTGNPNTVATVEVRLVDGKGKDLAPAWTQTLARKVEEKPPWKTLSDDRLPAGGQRAGSHTFTPALKGVPCDGAIEVRVKKGEANVLLRRVPIAVR